MAKSTKKLRRRLFFEGLEERRVMASLPFGAEPQDLGEFMLGRIAVTPVLLESDGTIDTSTEDWTAEHVAEVMENIQTGLNWWVQLLATKSSVHTLEWVIDRTYVDNRISTPYEPISRTSNAYSSWVPKFLTDIGFATTSSLETNIRNFNQSQREKLNTDWSFTIFVVNSRNDSDDSFAPGGSFSRAFAFAGGLFEVVPSGRPASTYTHETGHIFWARDEYQGSGNYFQKRGYYNAQNTNAIDLNPQPAFVQLPSIMSAGTALDTAFANVVSPESTLAQIGWLDSDGDGIFDIFDVPLELKGTGRMAANGTNYRFVGSSTAVALPNMNSSGLQNNITFNKVDRVQYRINDGSWITIASPGTHTANIDVTIPLSTTTGFIEIRTMDAKLGITSNVFRGALGAIPDVTTFAGINGFVWEDTDKDGVWDANETGMPNAVLTLVDSAGQPLQTQKTLEPDSFPNGLLASTQGELQIDVLGNNANGNVGIGIGANATTGTKVFRPFNIGGSLLDSFKGDDQQLRIRFSTPTSFASIDAIAPIDDTDVRFEAYDASGKLIQRVERKGMLSGQKVTLEVGSTTANIAYVIARGFDSSLVRFDNFVYGPKATAKSASDGSYSFANLPAGTYRIKVASPSPAYGAKTPASGIQTVTYAAASTVTHSNFGLEKLRSPWQNPTFPENVNNQGDVDPLDVLVLINSINLNGSRALDDTGFTPPPYLDPNGDRVIDPLDVLMIINYINARSNSANFAGGEGDVAFAAAFSSQQEGQTSGASSGLEANASQNYDVSPFASAVPFPSFALDAKPDAVTTRIISSSETLSRRAEKGMESCGCPACCAVIAGETSPSLLDVVQATSHLRSATVAPLETSLSKKESTDLLSLDDWLALIR